MPPPSLHSPCFGLLSVRVFHCLRLSYTHPPPLHPACCRILAEEGLARLPSVRPVTVATPCGPYQGLQVPGPDQLAVVSIVRAGEVLLAVHLRLRV
jgi:hypothetical protein